MRKTCTLILVMILLAVPCGAAQQETSIELKFCTAETVYGISAIYDVVEGNVEDVSVVFANAVKSYAYANYADNELRLIIASAEPVDLSQTIATVSATLNNGTVIAPQLQIKNLKYNGKKVSLTGCADLDDNRVCDICGSNLGNVHVVTFQTNGEAAAPNTQLVNHGSLVVKPEDPVRETHSFIGWATDANGEMFWNFETDAVTKSIILYAQWQEHQWDDAVYEWHENGCTAVESCAECGERHETPVVFELTADALSMSHVPLGLHVFIAGYSSSGQMIGCQYASAAKDIAITIPVDTTDIAEICVFFVNDRNEPLCDLIRQTK